MVEKIEVLESQDYNKYYNQIYSSNIFSQACRMDKNLLGGLIELDVYDLPTPIPSGDWNICIVPKKKAWAGPIMLTLYNTDETIYSSYLIIHVSKITCVRDILEAVQEVTSTVCPKSLWETDIKLPNTKGELKTWKIAKPPKHRGFTYWIGYTERIAILYLFQN